MKFCEHCDSCMKRVTDGGNIFYRCVCGNTMEASDDDLCIFTEKYIDEDSIDKYNMIIKNAPFDKSINLIKKECPGCKKEYMAHIHVSENETSVYVCKCGVREL
jgi:hypothetical protein